MYVTTNKKINFYLESLIIIFSSVYYMQSHKYPFVLEKKVKGE